MPPRGGSRAAASPLLMSLVLLGVDFRQAALDVRATLSYDPDAIRVLLARARTIPGLEEIAILSTCNRTEFYLVVAPGSDAGTRWLQLLRHDRAQARITDAACLLVRDEGEAVVTHLCDVAAGLDSALLGDAHVSGQVRAAYALGVEAGTVGTQLHRLFQTALRVAKQVRRETALGRGTVSIGSCVAQVLAHEAPRARRVAVLGTGAVATDVARHLAKRGGLALTIVSRDVGRAAALAAHVGGEAASLATLQEWLGDVDVVIGATSAGAPILTADMLPTARPDDAALLVCDLGVPRNVAADVPARLFTIDDIQARRDAALAAREAAVPAARALVAAAVGEWGAWQRQRAAVPAIVALYAREAMRRQAMVSRLSRQTGEPAAPLDLRLRRTGRQILHRHVLTLRARAAGSSAAPGVAAACLASAQG